MNPKHFQFLKRIKSGNIQTTIMLAFSIISLLIMLSMGIVMYIRFSTLSRQETIDSTQKLMEQTGENLEDYLVHMRQISDAVYYNVVKAHDFNNQKEEIQEGMKLLYEANRDSLRSIAIYNNHGSLMAAEPVASQKEDPNITQQDWFHQAVDEMENIHFSTPHIQNLFDDSTFRYYWVISSSRMVELTNGNDSQLGVLLVDMDFSNISRMMNQINTLNNGQYFYLCDNNGDLIYHSQQVQIGDGIIKENNAAIAGLKDGVHDETFEGKHRKVIVNTISYTGWKLVGVIPYSIFTHDMIDIRYFIAMLILMMAMMLLIINRVVSDRISSPILKLNAAVREYETGTKPQIPIAGSVEIRSLGNSIQRSYEQNEALMKKIVLEQNERRKSELDALQSQINPHFLYNTLDSITWMIEGERNEDATFMISHLARLFRISLSRGHTIIRVQEELQHAQSYLNIQQVRYKDTFSVHYDVDPAIYSYCAVKLTLQPLLENAINYGVSAMDDCGEIMISGKLQDDKILLSVSDNGLGIPKEDIPLLLTDRKRTHQKGSGVGLININNRIHILFGEEYGLTIESEPDVGTTVSICLPAVPYTEENRKILEQGYQFSKDLTLDMKKQEKDDV